MTPHGPQHMRRPCTIAMVFACVCIYLAMPAQARACFVHSPGKKIARLQRALHLVASSSVYLVGMSYGGLSFRRGVVSSTCRLVVL